jgi:hypothetical protein
MRMEPPRAVAREVHSAMTWSPTLRTLVTSSATAEPGSSAVPTLPRKLVQVGEGDQAELQRLEHLTAQRRA